MKVLSVLQPWASLIVLGHKKIETRSWATKYRGPLLIHASLGKDKAGWELYCDYFNLFPDMYKDLPRGVIIGQVNLVDVYPTEVLTRSVATLKAIGAPLNRLFYGTHHYTGNIDHEFAFGDYSPGRYGWLLSDPIMFDQPIPAKGQLNLWNYEGPIPNHQTETPFINALNQTYNGF